MDMDAKIDEALQYIHKNSGCSSRALNTRIVYELCNIGFISVEDFDVKEDISFLKEYTNLKIDTLGQRYLLANNLVEPDKWSISGWLQKFKT